MSFSLRTLFLAVAVAALGVAALVAQTRVWTSIFVGVGFVIIAAATIVAVYRRHFVLGVFSGITAVYLMTVFALFFPQLTLHFPTTTLLVEYWYATHKEDLISFAAINGERFSKDTLYENVLFVNYRGMNDDARHSLLSYYISGHMLFALIFATIAGLFTAFLTRPRKTE